MYIENNIIKRQLSIWLIFMFNLIAIMIVVGGLTRLTDSGLSITKWELFSGTFPPFSEEQWNSYFDLYKQIPEYHLQNFLMTMSDFKVIFWWEWAHRFLGRLIGITFLIPLLYFTFKINFRSLINYYLIFFLICFQGLVGWYMVSSGLIDKIDVSHFRLSIHLLVAFIILSLIYWNYLKLNINNDVQYNLNSKLPLIFLFLVFFQIVIGAFVSGMDAGKIYNSWPMMGDSYFPNDSNISDIFKVSAFSEPSLVQFMHRNLAYLIFIVYLCLAFTIYKKKAIKFYRPIKILGIFIITQILLGIFTILYGAHIYIASLHQISSIFLISSSIYLVYINSKS